MIGTDVKAMQELLMEVGYPLLRYGADGEYGIETEKVVKAFQREEGLEIDGKYGNKTYDALVDEAAEDDTDDKPIESPSDGEAGNETPGGTDGSGEKRMERKRKKVLKSRKDRPFLVLLPEEP